MAEGNDRDRVKALHRGEAQLPEMFTVKDVAEACGLPQPVVAQLVPRTWAAAEGGWMYTAEQLHSAVEIAAELRRTRLKSVSSELPDESSRATTPGTREWVPAPSKQR